jgi:hypothetical protein
MEKSDQAADPHPPAVKLAELKSSISPEELAEILRAAGYRATMVEQDQLRRVQSAAHGVNFVVGFGNPLAGAPDRYQDLSFYCPLTVRGELPASLFDAWNSGRRFGRLFRQRQFLVLSMDVLIAGGVAETGLRAHCEIWDRLIRELILSLQQAARAEPQAA